MLKFFKRMERTRNFVLLLFSVVMVVSLIAFYAPTNDLRNTLSLDTETVANVAGEKITVSEVAKQQESLSRGGRAIPAKLLVDGMIRERLVRLEAARLGLTATDAEVAERIRQQLKTDDGKPIDVAAYEQNVTSQYGSVAAFEQTVRDQISADKLQAFLTSGVTVSEEEILNDYKRNNTKFNLKYVPVSTSDLAQTIKPTDEELQKYFEQNKKNYYIGLPQKKIRYIFLNTSKIGEKLDISEADLKEAYNKIPEDKKTSGVQGQQIVLRVAKPEFNQEVLQKANKIVQNIRAKDNGKISEEAFAELAKGESEDPKTSPTGGKIPGLIKENPGNPTDPYQKLLTMQPDEITDPISYKDNYYILRRGEAVPKTFEDAKKELEVSLRNRRAYTAAAELAQKITDDLKQTKDVRATAAKFASQANMSVDEMVRETGYIKPGDDIDKIGVSDQFEQGIAALENQNDIGDKIPVDKGFAIPMLVDKKAPRDAELSEVKEQVAEAYKLDQAKARTEEVAKKIAAGADSADALNGAADANGLKAQDQENYIIGSPLGQGPTASTSEALGDAIYNLKPGEVTKNPIKAGDNWYVVGVTKREEANMDEFAKQRDQLVEGKLAQKRGQIFSDYLASVRQSYETNGKITIYQEEIVKLDAAAPSTPQQPQGLPPEIQRQLQEQMQKQQQQQAPPPPSK